MGPNSTDRTEINRRYRLAHPEKFTADARRERRKKNDAAYRKSAKYRAAVQRYVVSGKKKIVSKFYHYSKKFGLAYSEVLAIYESQHGLCGMCGLALPEELSKCHLDHSHRTNAIRALLHPRCNLLLGFIEADSDLTAKAFEYLEKFNVGK